MRIRNNKYYNLCEEFVEKMQKEYMQKRGNVRKSWKAELEKRLKNACNDGECEVHELCETLLVKYDILKSIDVYTTLDGYEFRVHAKNSKKI